MTLKSISDEEKKGWIRVVSTKEQEGIKVYGDWDRSVYIMMLDQVSGGFDGRKRFYKIGMSCDPEKRRKGLETANPFSLRIIFESEVFKAHYCKSMEELCHEHFEDFRFSGEWFLVDENIMEHFVDSVELHLKENPTYTFREILERVGKPDLYREVEK